MILKTRDLLPTKSPMVFSASVQNPLSSRLHQSEVTYLGLITEISTAAFENCATISSANTSSPVSLGSLQMRALYPSRMLSMASSDACRRLTHPSCPCSTGSLSMWA